MRNSIADALESLRSDVASHTKMDAYLGAPDIAFPGIYIFPFQFRVEHIHRHLPFPKTDNLTDSAPVVVRCLMMTIPANEFSMLDGGLECLLSRAVVDGGNKIVAITVSEISMDQLASIFLSARIELRLAVVFELKISSKE